MELTFKDWVKISQDLLEAGINSMLLSRKEGQDAVLQAWCDLGEEGWTIE